MRMMLAFAATLLAASSAPAQYHGIIVPFFDGPQPIARNVSTTLYLQVWRTLRRAPFPNPQGLDFGRSIARYSRSVFTPASSEDIAQYALGAEIVQLVMWGEVRELGDGVLVQAFVAAPTEAAHPGRGEVWTIRRGDRSVSLDLPRRVFDFAPVVLPRAVVEQFQAPDALRMCTTRQRPCSDLPLGEDWTAVRQDGPWAEVVSHPSERQGFMYLPDLDKLQNDISDFAAALLSYQRGDFVQATRLFSRVAGREGSQTSTRQDASVLAAISRARGGADVSAEFDRLAAASPDDLYLFQALLMAQLAEALEQPSVEQARQIASINRAVDANRHLFNADDRWIASMSALTGS